MTPSEFQERAIAGGWKPVEEKCRHVLMADENGCPFGFHYPPVEKMMLDVFAWQAIGKVEGWKETWHFGWFVKKIHGGAWEWHEHGDDSVFWGGTPDVAPNLVLIKEGWEYQMHRMIDALAEGKTINEYLQTL